MPNRRLDRLLLAVVLLLSLALNLTGIGYQQPSHWDPAVDGVHPTLALDAWENLFGERHVVSLKYPRTHVALMGAWERAWLVLRFGVDGARERADAVMEIYRSAPATPTVDARERFASERETLSEMILAGRVLSALFGALAVAGVFLLTRELAGAAAAGLAGLAVAVADPLVYYAHTLNVDAPYVGWAMLALALLARAVRTGGTCALVGSIVAATLSGATKDQAFGLFLLLVPAAVFLLLRPGGLAVEGRARVRFRTIVAAGAAGAILYPLLLGLPFDPEGVRTHFEHIFGEGVTPYRTHPATFAGQVGLLHESLLHLAAMVGLPWLVLGAAGALLLVVREPRKAALVVLPAAAYHASFVAPIGYVYMRFLLPVAVLLPIPAAMLVVAAVRGARGRRRWIAAAVAVAAVLALAPRMRQSVRLVELLPADPRVEAARWLDETVGEGESILALLEVPLHNLELPRDAVVHRVPAQAPVLPALERPTDWYVVSTFDRHRSAEEPRPPAPAPPPSTHLFGREYELVEVFRPAADHPVRRGATFQPTIGVYRRR